LRKDNPAAATRAILAIRDATIHLKQFPQSGRPFAHAPDRYRERLVPFGASGYAILYDLDGDIVRIVAIKSIRELGPHE
jgi:plasmid stabilization system protein ParE